LFVGSLVPEIQQLSKLSIINSFAHPPPLQLDIIQFFESFRLKPNGVQLVVRSDNKPTGEVRVESIVGIEMRHACADHVKRYSFAGIRGF
jgi:hypothetical protein